MSTDMGHTDRMVRLGAAIVLLALALCVTGGVLGWVLALRPIYADGSLLANAPAALLSLIVGTCPA